MNTVTALQAAALMPRGIGEVVPFAAHGRRFEVRRIGRSTWHLRDVQVRERSRFGTFNEIRADVGVALEVGCLAGGDKGRW